MKSHKIVLSARKVNKGEKISRWIERKAYALFEVPADGILIRGSVGVPPLYLRQSDIENILGSTGEDLELESWGDDASILPYS